MGEIQELYFKTDKSWRTWLSNSHNSSNGVYLIFYKVSSPEISMRWEDEVKVALCFGWIDSTVKSLGDGKRRQYFCPRKPKSVWSSQLFSPEQLANPDFIKGKALTGSVMDYAGINITNDRSKQGQYYDMAVGPYDI